MDELWAFLSQLIVTVGKEGVAAIAAGQDWRTAVRAQLQRALDLDTGNPITQLDALRDAQLARVRANAVAVQAAAAHAKMLASSVVLTQEDRDALTILVKHADATTV